MFMNSVASNTGKVTLESNQGVRNPTGFYCYSERKYPLGNVNPLAYHTVYHLEQIRSLSIYYSVYCEYYAEVGRNVYAIHIHSEHGCVFMGC